MGREVNKLKSLNYSSSSSLGSPNINNYIYVTSKKKEKNIYFSIKENETSNKITNLRL